MIRADEILETIEMIDRENLDIRTITMGISLRDCASESGERSRQKIYDKITRLAGNLVKTAEDIQTEYGIPIINKRISVTPIALIAESSDDSNYAKWARTLDKAAAETGVDFIGGFSALVHKGYSSGDKKLIESIPEALSTTEKVCSSVNIGTTRAGLNMDAVAQMGKIIKETAELTKDRGALGCAKLVVFCNAPEDNPFMAGAFHGVGEPESVINVGISGPGVVQSAIKKVPDGDFGVVAEVIKKSAFKITRIGELVAREASKRLDTKFGIVDLSLAPTPAIGDSVAHILEEMGLEKCGAPGTTAALALLNDAVKKGGAMASSYVGGLSGSFIPVSEDAGMIDAVKCGSLTIEKLEAMTCVCSVGLDMICIPGKTTAESISGIIADEAAIGMVNHKTTAVRVIPAPGTDIGDIVEFGGLLGSGPVMNVNNYNNCFFINRGGRIPAPINSMRN
ncbi:MAG: PFL family protein [Spirochaetales bacterium]|nr:PFL family protein [Spirochaetales bacterium]